MGAPSCNVRCWYGPYPSADEFLLDKPPYHLCSPSSRTRVAHPPALPRNSSATSVPVFTLGESCSVGELTPPPSRRDGLPLARDPSVATNPACVPRRSLVLRWYVYSTHESMYKTCGRQCSRPLSLVPQFLARCTLFTSAAPRFEVILRCLLIAFSSLAVLSSTFFASVLAVALLPIVSSFSLQLRL